MPETEEQAMLDEMAKVAWLRFKREYALASQVPRGLEFEFRRCFVCGFFKGMGLASRMLKEPDAQA